jgi:capsular exopolysaccharide synthesis family protein
MGHQRHFSSPWTEEASSQVTTAPSSRAVLSADPESSEPTAPNTHFPALRAWCGERLVSDPKCNPILSEQYRRLAAILHRSDAANTSRVLMVTSASPADGKTLTAINLAVTLSASYRRRVLLIDADLRCPSIGSLTGLEREVGLSEILRARTEQKPQLIAMTPTLSILPGGRPDLDPTGGLSSARMRHILSDAAAHFEWVIVDAPPVGAASDANLLAELVDKTLLVVRAAQTQWPMLQKTIDALGHDRILGIVLNAVDSSELREYGQAYGYSR